MHSLQFGRHVGFDVARRRLDGVRRVPCPSRVRFVRVGAQDIVQRSAVRVGDFELGQIDGDDIVLDVSHLEVPRPIHGIERSHDGLLFDRIRIGRHGVSQNRELSLGVIPVPRFGAVRISGIGSSEADTHRQHNKEIPRATRVGNEGDVVGHVLNEDPPDLPFGLDIDDRDIHGSRIAHEQIAPVAAEHYVLGVASFVANRYAGSSFGAANPVDQPIQVVFTLVKENASSMRLGRHLLVPVTSHRLRSHRTHQRALHRPSPHGVFDGGEKVLDRVGTADKSPRGFVVATTATSSQDGVDAADGTSCEGLAGARNVHAARRQFALDLGRQRICAEEHTVIESPHFMNAPGQSRLLCFDVQHEYLIEVAIGDPSTTPVGGKRQSLAVVVDRDLADRFVGGRVDDRGVVGELVGDDEEASGGMQDGKIGAASDGDTLDDFRCRHVDHGDMASRFRLGPGQSYVELCAVSRQCQTSGTVSVRLGLGARIIVGDGLQVPFDEGSTVAPYFARKVTESCSGAN